MPAMYNTAGNQTHTHTHTHTWANTSSFHLQRFIKGIIIKEVQEWKKNRRTLITKKKSQAGSRWQRCWQPRSAGAPSVFVCVCVCVCVCCKLNVRCKVLSHTRRPVWFSPRRAGWPGISVTFRGVTTLTYCSLRLPLFPLRLALRTLHTSCVVHVICFTVWMCSIPKQATGLRCRSHSLILTHRMYLRGVKSSQGLFYTGAL